MDIVFHRLVQRDLNQILDHYESRGGAALADRFFTDLDILLQRISQEPARFHQAGHGLRRANLKEFPYHLLFRAGDTSIRVLVLRHHKRRPSYGMQRR